MPPRLIPALLTLCLIVGCHDGMSAEMTDHFGGSENLRVLRTATAVSVYRVLGSFSAPGHADPGAPTVAGYPVIAGPVKLDPAASRHLVATLLDPDTYDDFHTLCEFNPGYVARFTDAERRTLDLAFCFGCYQLAVVRPPSDRVVGFLSMMSGSDRLLAQLKPLFPADATATRQAEPIGPPRVKGS